MAEQDAVDVHLALMKRIIACERLGLRLKRLRLTPDEYKMVVSAYTRDYGCLPPHGYRYRGYPIVTNWER